MTLYPCTLFCIFVLSLSMGCGSKQSQSIPRESLVVHANQENTMKIDIAKTSDESQVEIAIEFRNSSDRHFPVLKRLLFDGEIMYSPFIVKRNGVDVQYIGMLAKLPQPRQSDMALIGPGETYKATVRLNSLYDVSQAGRYTVKYSVYNQYPDSDRITEFTSNAISFTIK